MLPSSHSVPWNPGGQIHSKVANPCLQLAPFWQGSGSHSLTSEEWIETELLNKDHSFTFAVISIEMK